MDNITFCATAYIEDREITMTGTLKECSEWADKMLKDFLTELKEIKLERIQKEN